MLGRYNYSSVDEFAIGKHPQLLFRNTVGQWSTHVRPLVGPGSRFLSNPLTPRRFSMRHFARIACEPRVTAPTHHCICEEFLNHVKPTVRAFVGIVSSKPPARLRYLRVCVAFNTNISRVAALAHQRVREKPRHRFPTTHTAAGIPASVVIAVQPC
jgi:hypothetical protein